MTYGNPAIGGLGSFGLNYPTTQRRFRKAVLGDGYTMDEARDGFLKGLNQGPPKQQSTIDPLISQNLFSNPSIGNGTEFDFLNGMEFPDENVQDSPLPGDPAEAPKPSPLGMLPAVGNLISLSEGLANGPERTRLQRASFDRVDYNPMIESNAADIRRGINTANYNVRNNARTAGQRTSGMASMNLMGAKALGQNRASLEGQQRNTNVQIANRENTINTQIANQEEDLNARNRAAHRTQMMSDGMGILTSIAGFGADTAAMGADFAKNQSFLESLEYASPILRTMFDGKQFGMKTKYKDNGN